MPLQNFHPAVAAWFEAAFAAPTPAQREAWPAIRRGENVLIAAPTGSGKTLAAFLAAIDALVREGVAGTLTDETHVVYVSPLKALSNDVRINLEVPLEGIRAQLEKFGLPDVEIRTAVRTGDTPQAERNAMRKRPPHIVVTTPESLYILLGSESGRRMLQTTRTVIVDEIHALVQSKRGSHLALTLERLDALCGQRCTRIGLSATQNPIEKVADFLVGARPSLLPPGEGVCRLDFASRQTDEGSDSYKPSARSEPLPQRCALGATRRLSRRERGSNACTIIDAGHQRARDLAIELTNVPLQPVMSNDAWGLVYDRLAELIERHRTTLIFANTRRAVERTTRHLAERLGKDAVAAHHGSLSKEKRLDAEQRLKSGNLRALVATASLELGIDIGEVDLVCQLGSPRSIAAFLQRAGRAGHAVDGISKARLFPTSRDDLVECVALLDCVRRGELDTLRMPPAPLDVLAQQIVAEVACGERGEAELFETFARAYPYRSLTRTAFTEAVRMLAEGYSTRRGTRAAYLHRDAVNGKLRARRGARLVALTSGGAIPDTADYDVVLEPQSLRVGSVNEDFAVESIAGDIFQLGNQSYRILRVERGKVRVEDAHGAPPSIPFWLGEAPGRSDELSFAVARLREELAARLEPLSPWERGRGEGADTRNVADSRKPVPSPPAPLPEGEGSNSAIAWLMDEIGIDPPAARQLIDYLAAARAELGLLPTQSTLAMERFFDESGGMQLIIHSPFGSRLNRAWGLALRKRFCRSFNFELQAAATEDAIVLSLSTSHSFPLDEVARYLHSNSVCDVLTQALLDAPMFALRFRWNAASALALPRFAGGAKVPPQIQRMKSEDLLATVFPDQVACLENIVGERKIPDHPLVAQTLQDCLYDAMDLDGLTALLKRLESGEARIVARDLTAPSQLAAEILGARPYAFLDGAPLEERRTQAVASRGFVDAQSAEDLGKLDADAIAAVREEAWPAPRDADEMHEALLALGAVDEAELARSPAWQGWLDELAQARRATVLLDPSPPGRGEGVRVRLRASSRYRPEPSPAASRLPLPQGEGFDLWIAAEPSPMWRAVFPDATLQPAIEAPAEFAAKAWTREEALVEILRARLACTGPVRASELAHAFGVPDSDIAIALATLEREGIAMRGRFTPDATEEEWCDRHLLARIHRRTLQRLRREIEPVAPRDFMRFLLDWQHVAPDARMRGPDALAAVLAQLEGFEAPASAWESQLLPARVAGYDIAWLDALCGAGRIAWTRLRASAGGAHASPVRASPIVLLPRRQLTTWNAIGAQAAAEPPALSSRAQAVVEFLAQRGASFFGEIADGTRLLKAELEDALGELVGAGMVGADSFAGLRALLQPAAKRNHARHRRLARHMLNGIEDAGRWSLVHALHPSPIGRGTEGEGPDLAKVAAKPDPHPSAERSALRAASPGGRGAESEAREHVARVLLRRWGVVFWKLLEREAAWLPPWRELRRVCQRLEARGEIRGGRFVEGIVGEQFALPEAVEALRRVRKRQHDGALIAISGADPLNLVGSVLPGTKVPAVASSRIVYRDGVPVASRIAGEIVLLDSLSPDDERAVRVSLRENRPTLPSRAIPTITT
ncbi:MAG: putative ATP-dependent DNA helicase [Rhodanobacteraceae bacterium]|jgi:ATP-dependent Lhr-like helicase|nr:MAG: putative ATP-dependent DNA helicase [Rhodanobacteraceae bacterium]